MNNLEKLKILEETVKLRRQVMKLDEAQMPSLKDSPETSQYIDPPEISDLDAQVSKTRPYDSHDITCPSCGKSGHMNKSADGQVYCSRCKQPVQSNPALRQSTAGSGNQQDAVANQHTDPYYSPPKFNPNAVRGQYQPKINRPMKESAACSSGAGSRTGMDEEFAQDAPVSSDRKRGHELDESLKSYYKIAGL